MKQKWALISVFDKSNLERIGPQLEKLGYQLLSTGGSAKALRELGCSVTDVSTVTKHPEILGGRVKTLHPMIHGGILYRRSHSDDLSVIDRLEIPNIEVVCVNLYPFPASRSIQGADDGEAIELIDIGGPAMIRAAAKNFADVSVLVDPSDYDAFIAKNTAGNWQIADRLTLAAKAFEHVAAYDAKIASSMRRGLATSPTDENQLPATVAMNLDLQQTLRYGENPHQKGGFYHSSKDKGLPFSVLGGKELSYNNLLDLDAALRITYSWDAQPACAIVKHNNPCGVALVAPGSKAKVVAAKALQADSKSAFGGIAAFNVEVDLDAAKILSPVFLEVVAAPAFTDDALEVLRNKKNLRIIRVPANTSDYLKGTRIVSCLGGFLVQDQDGGPDASLWQTVTKVQPTQKQIVDLDFAMRVCAHVKSNAIVLARDGQTLGIGAGQMSRIDAVNIAISKAREFEFDLQDAVAASDAFFPFRDAVDLLIEAGITAIVQPGGSIRDQEVIDACQENGKKVSMVFAKLRHFRH